MNGNSSPLVPPRALLAVLLICVACLVVVSSLSQIARLGPGNSWLSRSIPLVNLGGEHNLPTWFSSIELALAGFLALLVSRDRRSVSDRFALYWAGLGLVMLYISLDDAIGLHERISRPLRTQFELGGIFFYSWLIPGLAITAVLWIVSVPFLRALPRRTATIMMIAGAVFVVGSVGMEMAEGCLAEAGANRSLLFVFLVTVEEALEMCGVALFIFALCDYAGSHCPRLGGLFNRSAGPK